MPRRYPPEARVRRRRAALAGEASCAKARPARQPSLRPAGRRFPAPAKGSRTRTVPPHPPRPPTARHPDWPCPIAPCATRIRHWCRADTSGQIRRPRMLAHLRNFQFDIPDIGHREEVGDLPPAPDQTPVLLDTEQHVRRLPAVSNDHRPPFGGLLGPPGVLVELAAGQRGDGHGGAPNSM